MRGDVDRALPQILVQAAIPHRIVPRLGAANVGDGDLERLARWLVGDVHDSIPWVRHDPVLRPLLALSRHNLSPACWRTRPSALLPRRLARATIRWRIRCRYRALTARERRRRTGAT